MSPLFIAASVLLIIVVTGCTTSRVADQSATTHVAGGPAIHEDAGWTRNLPDDVP